MLEEVRVSDNRRKPEGYVIYATFTGGSCLVAGDAGWRWIRETFVYGIRRTYYHYLVPEEPLQYGIHLWTQPNGPWSKTHIACTEGCVQCSRSEAKPLRLDPVK